MAATSSYAAGCGGEPIQTRWMPNGPAFLPDPMTAWREVKAAQAAADEQRLTAARTGAQVAKVGLGERGPVWWKDDAPDFNRILTENSPYAGWFAGGRPDIN